MKTIKGFLGFWYNFIVGDDWLLAAGVIIGLCLAGLSIQHPSYWPLLPIVVLATLVISLFKAIRTH